MSEISPEQVSEAMRQMGRMGARKRWGEQRHLDLRDLTSEQRKVVLALYEAQKAAKGGER